MADEKNWELLERLRSDDRDALQLLFRQFYPTICQVIHRYIKEKTLVEDLAQDLFLKLWEKRKRIQVNSSFKAYLCRMAVNESIDYLRKVKRLEQKSAAPQAFANLSTPSTEDQYLQGELQQRIQQAIHTLPPRCQLIFKLSRYEELTYQEIAQRLDISIKTVENQMGKALKLLRQRLKP
ncbi:MAG: RNA polymerase sigma-70 factor [Bacteroidota bacterium]